MMRSKLFLHIVLHSLCLRQTVLSSPVEYVQKEVTKNRQIEAYFNLNNEWLNIPPRSRCNVSPASESGRDKLERIRPVMSKNQAQITALKTDHDRIVASIKIVRRRDQFLGRELETFDRHMKVLVHARLYELYTDLPFTLCASYQAAQASTDWRFFVTNLITPFLKCVGLDYLAENNKLRTSDIGSLDRSNDHSLGLADENLTGCSSQTMGARASESKNQVGSLDTTKNEEINLQGEVLGLIQHRLFDLGELWQRLEILILYGITEPCAESPKDPLVSQWLSVRHQGKLHDDILSTRISRDQNKFTTQHFIAAVFGMGEYIKKYSLLPSIFPAKIKIFEPCNLVPIINFYITQSLNDENIRKMLMSKPQGIISGLELVKAHDFFLCFHRIIEEKLTEKHNKIFTYHMVKSISEKFIQETGMSSENVGCKVYLKIHQGYCANKFLTDANELDQMLRIPSEDAYTKIIELRKHQIFPTVQELFRCFDDPSAILKGYYQECKLLSIYYMVHFMYTHYKKLIDELINPREINTLLIKKKIEYIDNFFCNIKENISPIILPEIEDVNRNNINEWKGKVESTFKVFRTGPWP